MSSRVLGMAQESFRGRPQVAAEYPRKVRLTLLDEWRREHGGQPSRTLMDEWRHSLTPGAEAGRRLAHLRKVAGQSSPL